MKLQSVTLPKTRNAKLMRLYSIIEAAPPEQMDIDDWRCGTAHCVGGWAATDPIFNEMGLRLKDEMPRFGPDFCGVALQYFFGLTRKETTSLFYEYRSRMGEAAKQEALLKIKGMMG